MRMIFIEKKLRAKDLFWVNAACDGCGTCAGVCPSGNIDLEDGRPTWKDHCEICVACLHWCPRRAIQAGRATLKRKRYHHPSVSLSDMLIRPVHTPRRKSLIT
jgi:MinD superfamily P-loop ATPase